ncbi:hypothetical protein [Thiolapillus brandeum]|uniref:GTPase n=1 Tax=Thiolapillus brandeum TaxID=1076588 RepID=A0A7U6GHB0_9GAMM|nr:hypothetical protein [Thiolapillus brandeum]BAO43589.1 hypothetical protein TBH_C0651 [Thiolapillus brandeum]
MADSRHDENSKPPRVELSIPKQTEAPEDSFLLNPREVKRWAEQLPVANIGETARQVYKTLATFNRIRIPTLVRAEIIELFREPVRYINTNITKHYLNVGFPLSPKSKKAARLATELCNEIAISYKILFLEQVMGNEKNFNQKLVIVAAQRALQYMKQRMFHNLLIYRDYQKGLWREAHYLYAWASQNHVHHIGVKETSKFLWRRKNAQSIEDVYKDMVLIATTSPYRLTQTQLRLLHDKLQEWDKHTEIGLISDMDNHSAGIFYLNLWSDEPPQKTISPAQRNDSRYRAFDLNGVLSRAREEYDDAEWESPAHMEKNPHHLSRSLLTSLIRGWNKSLERKFARNNLHHEMYAIVGLTNLLHLLEQNIESGQEQQQDKGAQSGNANPSSHLTWNDSVFSTLAIASPTNSLGGDSIFAESSSNLASALLGTPMEHEPANLFDAMKRDPNAAFSVLTYNESVEGYCLGWKDSYPMKVRVGDILGIRSPNNPEEFSVAVTRWLKDIEDDQLYLGIQVMASNCSPITLTPGTKASSNRQNQYRCLLLSGSGIDSERQGILTNTRAFELNTIMTMVTEFGEHQIKLTKWVESNNNFIHYHFTYVEQEESRKKSGDPTDDFQDLWNDL